MQIVYIMCRRFPNKNKEEYRVKNFTWNWNYIINVLPQRPILYYIYNIQEYSPYASAGADLDALIHSVLFFNSNCNMLHSISYITCKSKRANTINRILTALK